MEPVVNKLQEGVKYPRFERDATKTINDLVDHITKERGVYSSSIEPNPSEHSIWFNTNNNTLYIYDGNTWATVSDKNVHISKEGEEFFPYPVVNILNSTSHISEWYIEENKHYVIIINANNIKKYLNYIVEYNDDREFTIIGDDTNFSGTFLVNIYDTYIYYIKLSSTYIEENNVFYCSNGLLYYNGPDTSNENDGIDISGFYNENRLKDIIEEFEGNTIENINLNGVFIEPENESTIIIGKQAFNCDVSMLGEQLDSANIYVYNNTLHIGNNNDARTGVVCIVWNDVTVYCNCKYIGDITITHEYSSLNTALSSINFIVGNNNKLVIPTDIAECISDCYIYVINETNDDNSSVHIGGLNGTIQEYVNLCGTKLGSTGENKFKCKTFVSTTIDDLDRTDDPIDILTCETVIIDAPYRPFVNGSINGLVEIRNGYTTSEELANFLYTNYHVQWETVINNTTYFNDRVDVQYITKDTNRIVYEHTIYKR